MSTEKKREQFRDEMVQYIESGAFDPFLMDLLAAIQRRSTAQRGEMMEHASKMRGHGLEVGKEYWVVGRKHMKSCRVEFIDLSKQDSHKARVRVVKGNSRFDVGDRVKVPRESLKPVGTSERK